jgi:hypothetical protein
MQYHHLNVMKISKIENRTPQIGSANAVQKRAIISKNVQLIVQLI